MLGHRDMFWDPSLDQFLELQNLICISDGKRKQVVVLDWSPPEAVQGKILLRSISLFWFEEFLISQPCLHIVVFIEAPATFSTVLYLVISCWFLVSRIKTACSPLVLAARNILTMSSTLFGTSWTLSESSIYDQTMFINRSNVLQWKTTSEY